MLEKLHNVFRFTQLLRVSASKAWAHGHNTALGNQSPDLAVYHPES